MANKRSRLKALNKKRGIGKVKSSTATSVTNVNSGKQCINDRFMNTSEKVQNGDLSNDADSLCGSQDNAVTNGILPIITRSGRIRKRKDNLRFMGNILKSELMIDEPNKVTRTRSRNNNGANNNNDLALTNNNTENKSDNSANIKSSNKCATSKSNNNKINLKNKSKTVTSSSENTSDKMENGLREVMNTMRSALSPNVIESDLNMTTPFAKSKKNTSPKLNRDLNKKGPKSVRYSENIAKKRKTHSESIEKTDKSTKMKQVTLSNGVVLTLTMVRCDYCQKSFSNKASLTRHMLSHVDLRCHSCPQCPRKFRYQSTLKIHLQRRHVSLKDIPEYYMCNICDKAFLMQENLELHLASHVKTENNFKCLYCDKKFSYRLLLVQHEKTHLVTGRFKCYLCEMSYACRSGLTQHLKSHTKVKDYICHYCGKEFFRLNSIKRHVQVCHGGQRIQCPVCMKKLKGHLTEHMRVHEQQRPHVCPDCGQRFTQSTQLTVHRRSHTGDRPYPCRICQRPFGHSNALMLHIRRHTGEKPFTCAMCPMTFSQLPHMKTHMSKIHGKENAYKCQKCHEFFKLKTHLETHMKNCTVGDVELSFEEKIQASVQFEAIESAMSLTKMRFLLALLLTMIASKDKLKCLGFNKRLIDDLLEESLEAMGHSPCKDKSLSPVKRLKTNLEILLNGTIPKAQMDKFRYENKSTEEILMLLTDEKR